MPGRTFCVRAGKDAKHAADFVRGGYVAIGGPKVRELRMEDSYADIRMRIMEAYPEELPGRIRNRTGQINNFIRAIEIGDFVFTPDRDYNLLHVGEVISYPIIVLGTDDSCPYPHRRIVEWGKDIMRSELPDAIQRSLKSRLSVFRVRGAESWIEENAHALFPPEDEDALVGPPGPPIPSPVEVEAREGYRIWVRYDDGASGEVDLSHLTGKGVFAAWNDRAFFEAVRVTDYGAVAWGEDIDICPDTLYMRLTGKTVEELMPALRGVATDA